MPNMGYFRYRTRSKMDKGTIKNFLERFSESEKQRVDIELDKLDKKVAFLWIAILQNEFSHLQKWWTACIIKAMDEGINIYQAVQVITNIWEKLLEKWDSEDFKSEGKCIIKLAELILSLIEDIRVKDWLWQVDIQKKVIPWKQENPFSEEKSIRDNLK